MHKDVNARKADTKKEIEAAVHDPVAVGRGDIGVRRNIKEVPMLHLNPMLAKPAPPSMAKILIHVAECQFELHVNLGRRRR